jgi:hypothetical protein
MSLPRLTAYDGIRSLGIRFSSEELSIPAPLWTVPIGQPKRKKESQHRNLVVQSACLLGG